MFYVIVIEGDVVCVAQMDTEKAAGVSERLSNLPMGMSGRLVGPESVETDPAAIDAAIAEAIDLWVL